MPRLVNSSPIPLTVGRRFGTLTVARIYDNGMVFSTCECGSSRTCTRQQLVTKSIKACIKCAVLARHQGKRAPLGPQKPRPCKKCGELCRSASSLCRNCKVNIPNPEPPLPPSIVVAVEEKPKACHPLCRVRLISRKLYELHQPDCPRLNLFPIDLTVGKKTDSRVYPETVI